MRYCLFISLLLANYAHAQEITYAVLADKDSKVTKKGELAYYLIIVKNYGDTSFERVDYHFRGPRISSVFFKDPQLKIKHGNTTHYNDSGRVVIKGSYSDNKKSGTWYHIKERQELDYENDSLLSVHPAGSRKISLDPNRPNKVEIESAFPGGIKAYMNFQNKNITFPDRALKMGIQGTVIIQFIVDIDGSPMGGEISNSVEFSIDEEALRLIRIMPKFEPAILDGKKVKSYKKQPITFKSS